MTFSGFSAIRIRKASAWRHPHHPKIPLKFALSGCKFFAVEIFGKSRHKTQQILAGFASILTKSWRKSTCKKRVRIIFVTLSLKEMFILYPYRTVSSQSWLVSNYLRWQMSPLFLRKNPSEFLRRDILFWISSYSASGAQISLF